ncbi:MAG: hypothetical protein ACP5MH_12045 [Thermoproteus sp.]
MSETKTLSISTKKLVAIAVLVTASAAFYLVIASTQSYIQVLFNSWLEGKPKGLVEIEVATPHTGGRCLVAVHRLPTYMNPTPNWRSEVVYRGVVDCGAVVTAESLINLHEVGYNGTAIIYDSPQYIVIVISNNWSSFIKTITTKITRPITKIHVDAYFGGSRRETGVVRSSTGVDPESTCDVAIDGQTYSPGPELWGHCVAPTKIAYLNSIQGLQTQFKVVGGVPASAVYLEGWGAGCFSDFDHVMEPCPASTWSSAGKFRTVSVVTQTSDPIANGQRAVVWGGVYYQYEHYAYSDWGGFTYYVYDILYPVKLLDLLPVQVVGSYAQPPAPPSYASPYTKGDAEIWFTPVSVTDNKLALSTSIGVNIDVFAFSVSISVSPYEAGENNAYYTTPSVIVHDISGRSYAWWAWWYLDNNPMTYEVQFYGS